MCVCRWASESLQVACNKVYKDPTQNTRLIPDFKTTPHMERQWGQVRYSLTDVMPLVSISLYRRMCICVQEMQQRILTAGARLVIVLNSILEQQEAKKLRQGSGVEVQGRSVGVHNDPPIPPTQRHTNVCVCLVGEEEHKAKPRVPAWVRNLGTNLIIIVVVLVPMHTLTRV